MGKEAQSLSSYSTSVRDWEQWNSCFAQKPVMGNDHSFDYDGAMQNMSLWSVLQRKEELFFSKKQEVQGSANTHSGYFPPLQKKKKNNKPTLLSS